MDCYVFHGKSWGKKLFDMGLMGLMGCYYSLVWLYRDDKREYWDIVWIQGDGDAVTPP